MSAEKPWTTAEVEAIGRSWAYREKAIATTRALETALREIDCGQDVVCGSPPGCVRHWEERNRELVRERDEARAEETALLEQRDRARRALAAEIETTRATKARVAELVTALEGMIEPAEGVGSELVALSAGCGEYLSRLDAAIDNASAALAKAKGGTS